MLAIQLKNYLKQVPDLANILIFSKIIDEERQLLMSDLDRNQDGNIVIDAEYEVPVKVTKIKEERIKDA
jgi:hypothetical protein